MSLPFGFGGSVANNSDGLADGVIQQLELAMNVGLLNDGDKLPAEPRLAEQLGVSTVTLRQGLARLRSRGVLVTQRGRGGGSYMRDSHEDNVRRAEEELLALTTVELRDLGDVLAGQLAQSARLAAARALPDEIDRLDHMILAFAEGDSPRLRRKYYCRFHIDAAVAAQSPRLMMTSVQLLGQFAPLLWNSNIGADSQFVERYTDIAAAMRSHDAVRAQDLVYEQIDRETRLLIAHRLRAVAKLNSAVGQANHES